MKASTVITVPEWFFDKVNEAARNYHIYLVGEYDEKDMLDHTKLRIDEVLAETEKAYKVVVDAETERGYKGWTTWIPKSIIA